MADRKFSPVLRSISIIVLAFFLWTFGGVFDFAYAVKSAEAQKSGSPEGSSQKASVRAASSAQASRPEVKFEKTLEDIGR